MLSQAVYWSKRVSLEDGWFWKKQDEWYQETFMTRSEQETARRRLREKGFIEERRCGIPAKIYYRVVFEEVERALLTAEEEFQNEPF